MPTISNAKDKRDNEEYSIEEIASIKKETPDKFEKIKSNLVCYECSIPQMIPKLGMINEHHYAKSSEQRHSFDCYYFGDEYTQKEVESIVSKIKNDRPSQHQVANAFSQIQRYLNRDKSESNTIISDPLGDRNKSGETQSTSNNNQQLSKSKYIPRKKLNKKITDDDEGIWKIYYGQVGMEFHSERNGYENYFVSGKVGDEKFQYRISIGISESSLLYFKDKETNILGKIKKKKRMINLMVLGKISKKGNFNNITVFDSRLLHLER